MAADMLYMYHMSNVPVVLAYKIVGFRLLPDAKADTQNALDKYAEYDIGKYDSEEDDELAGRPRIIRAFVKITGYETDIQEHKDIDLDEYIGNYDGGFDVSEANGKGFSQSSSLVEGSINVKKCILNATIGSQQCTLDLNLFFHMFNDKVVIERLSTNITKTGMTESFEFDLDTGVFSALVLGKDAKLHLSEINLREHEDFKDHGVWSGADLKVDWEKFSISSTSQEYDAFYGEVREITTTLDILSEVKNYDGVLTPDQSSFFDMRDGALVQFLENVPIIGWFVFAGHMLAQNTSDARRAAAKAAYVSTVFVAGLIGTALGGPAGCAIASAIATGVGLGIQDQIARGIYDGRVADDISPISMQSLITETIANIIPGIGQGVVTQRLNQIVRANTYKVFEDNMSTVVNGIVKKAASGGLVINGSYITSAYLGKITGDIQNGILALPQDE